MAYPGGPNENRGYLSDSDSNHYPGQKVNPNQVHLEMAPRKQSEDYSSAEQHDYEELGFNHSKPNKNKVRLSSYSIDNDDYTYSIGGSVGPSITSGPSTNSLAYPKSSRAPSAISTISERPRKKENPLYDKVDLPVRYTKKKSAYSVATEPPYDPSTLKCLWCLLIIFMILTVILLAAVIVLVVMVLGKASTDDLATYNNSVEALASKMTAVDAKVAELAKPSGNITDPNFISKIQNNVTENQANINLIQTDMNEHSKAAVANFTEMDTLLTDMDSMNKDMIKAIQLAQTKSENVRQTLDDYLAKSLSKYCEYTTRQLKQRIALKASINSGKLSETEDWVLIAPKCSVGGNKRQDVSLRFAPITDDPSRTEYWCLCQGSPEDNTVDDRECRIHALKCKSVMPP